MNEHCEQILPANPDRKQWLAARRSGVGSSDVSAILGLSKYRTALQVFWEKLDVSEPDDSPPSEAAEIGSLLEPQVAQLFTRRTGKAVEHIGLMRSTRWPWMIASCDYVVVGENAVLECKTCSWHLREEWDNDEVPDHAMLQSLHQMAVTGCERVYVAVLIGGQHFEYRVVERDEQALTELAEMERGFWHDYVVAGEVPAARGPDIGALTQRRNDQEQDPALFGPQEVSWLRQYMSLGETVKEHEKKRCDVKALIVQAMGDSTAATTGDGEAIVTYKPDKKGIYSLCITSYGKKVLA